MKKIALIPAYEPDEKLINLVNELKDNKYEIIVVNDGSNKNFDYIFDKIKNKVHLISYKVNKGKGYALKKGINYIKDNYKEYICITIDSDGQHKVSDANKLYEYNLNNLDDVVEPIIDSEKLNEYVNKEMNNQESENVDLKLVRQNLEKLVTNQLDWTKSKNCKLSSFIFLKQNKI